MASSNFLTWDSPGINIENDAQYAADSLRSNGAPTGAILPSPTFNKFALQTSIFAAAFCEMLANNGFSTSDSNQATLAAVLDNIQLSTDVKPLQVAVPFSPTPVFDCSLASSFRIALSGNVTSSTLINAPPAGGIITFFIISNPGVFGFVWPISVRNGRNVQTESLGNLLVQQFISDGTNLFPDDTFEQVVYQDLLAFEAAQSAENTGLTNLGNSAVALANAAQGTANTAITNAAAAQSTANGAASNANMALSDIAALTVTSTANDVTGSRSFGTTFTNTSNKTVLVSVIMERTGTGGGDYRLDGFLNGTVVASSTSSSTIAGMTIGITWMVPPGSSYSANPTALQGSASIALQHWEEWPFSL